MGKDIEQQNYTLIIRNLGKTFKVSSWKYWEIIDELISRGVEREEAYECAKWAMRAKPSDMKHLSEKGLLYIKM